MCTAVSDVDPKSSFGSPDIGQFGLQSFDTHGKESSRTDEMKAVTPVELQNSRVGYVSQSAVALRCRVMPPPCLKNPYVKNGSEFDADPFSNQRSKCAGAVFRIKLFFFFIRVHGKRKH